MSKMEKTIEIMKQENEVKKRKKVRESLVATVKLSSYKSGNNIYYRINIPREFVEKLGWEPETILLIRLDKSRSRLIIEALG